MKKSHLRCVWCIFRALVAPTLIIYSLTACSGGVGSLLGDVLTGNFGGGDDIGDASSGESSSGSNATDASSESSGSSSDESGTGESGSDSEGESGDSDLIPTAQLPYPSLKTDDTFAFAQDSEQDVPITGSVSDYGSDSIVAVSTSDITASAMLIKSPRPLWERVRERGFFIADAYASTDNVLCSTEGITCCPLNDDGTFECYYETTDSSVTSVYLAVIDGNGDIVSDSVEIDVDSNFHYLGETPQDVVLAGDDIYTITNGVAVKTTYNSEHERFEVAGDHEDNYADFTAEGSKIAYDSSSSSFGVLDSQNGVSLMELADDTVTDLGASATQEDATGYTAIKAVDGHLYYGISEEIDDEAYVYNALYAYQDSLTQSRATGSNFKFIATEDGLTHKETLAFDINSSNRGVFVFKDADDNIRARISNGSDTMFGGDTPLSCSSSCETFDFKDIQFFDRSHALLLDAANDMAWIISADADAQTVTSTLDSTSGGIEVGDNPVAMVINTTGTRAYVLDAGNESISVINLKNSDGTTRVLPRRIATQSLSSEVSLGSRSFTPNTLKFADGKLIVGSSNMKALLVLDVANITETSLDDETTTEETSTETSTGSDTASETATESSSDTGTSTSDETETDSSSSTETASTTNTSSSTSTSTESSSGSSTTTTSSTSTASSTATATAPEGSDDF